MKVFLVHCARPQVLQQPDLVGLSFLSTTSYPYAKILARQIRRA